MINLDETIKIKKQVRTRISATLNDNEGRLLTTNLNRINKWRKIREETRNYIHELTKYANRKGHIYGH